MSTVDLGDFVVTQHTALRDTSGQFVSAVEAGAALTAKELAEQVAQLAQVYAPRGRGRTHTPQGPRLASTLGWSMIGSTQAAAYATAPHAAPQEKGAAPHPIPNAFGSGVTVMHPGNPAVRYLERAGRAVAILSPAVARRNMPGG